MIRKILLFLMVSMVICTVTSIAFAGLNEGIATLNRYDFEKALAELRPLAQAGNAQAQFYLGFMYHVGAGVSVDDNEAMKWLHLSADQSNAEAQNQLGEMYEHGDGVPKDYNEALKWLRLAADQGNAYSQFYLGINYARAQGLKQSLIAAYAFYTISAANQPLHKENATDMLTEIMKEMTPGQIEEAKSLADRMSKTGALLRELDAYIKTQSP